MSSSIPRTMLMSVVRFTSQMGWSSIGWFELWCFIDCESNSKCDGCSGFPLCCEFVRTFLIARMEQGTAGGLTVVLHSRVFAGSFEPGPNGHSHGCLLHHSRPLCSFSSHRLVSHFGISWSEPVSSYYWSGLVAHIATYYKQWIRN